MMLVFGLFVLSITCLGTTGETRRGTLVTLPRILQLGSPEKICFSFHGFDDSETFMELQFGLQDKDTAESYYNSTEAQELLYLGLSIKAPQCVGFTLPANITVPWAEMKVKVRSISSDYMYEGTEEVSLERGSLHTIIQTDKPMYKPGQKLRFRVLVVDNFLKPQVTDISKIIIEDPLGVRMMQWLDIPVDSALGKGIADLEMPLSEEPVQGEWKITVWPAAPYLGLIRDEFKTEKKFTVEEYVLPKYEITISPPPYLDLLMEETQVTVCAKYTYGEPVRGLLDFKACFAYRKWVWRRGSQLTRDRCFNITEMEVEGCTTVTIPLGQDILATKQLERLPGAKFEISANITENATGVVLSETDDSAEVSSDIFKVSFKPYSPDSYKPNLPYFGKVVISKPDDTPAPGEEVEISYTDPDDGTTYRHVITTDSRGHAPFQLAKIGRSESSIQITAELPQHKYDYNESYYTPSNPRGYHTVKEWYSPSSSYLQVEPLYEAVDCETNIMLNVSHTVDEEVSSMTIFYQILAQGNILGDGSSLRLITPDLIQHFSDPEICPEDQEFTTCGSSCTPTCAEPNPICTTMCVSRCECPSDKPLLHNGQCFNQSQCPPDAQCTNGQIHQDCGGCTTTCDNLNPICSRVCHEGCFCPNVAPVWHNETCIREAHCPGQPDNSVALQSDNMIRYELPEVVTGTMHSTFTISFATQHNQGLLMEVSSDPNDTMATTNFTSLSLWMGPYYGGLHAKLKYGSHEETVNFAYYGTHFADGQTHIVKVRWYAEEQRMTLMADNGEVKQADFHPLDNDTSISYELKYLYFGRNERTVGAAGFDGCLNGAYFSGLDAETSPFIELHQSPSSSSFTLQPAGFEPTACDTPRSTWGPTTTTTALPELETKAIVSLPISVGITKAMSPLAHLLVYFVRDDGEVIADSVDIKIKSCLRNEVQLNFTEESNLPGVETPLNLQAAPGSVCSLNVMDKSVKLHGGDDRLDISKVMAFLNLNDISPNQRSDSEYCQEQLGGDDNGDDWDRPWDHPWGPPMPLQRPWRQKRRAHHRVGSGGYVPWYRRGPSREVNVLEYCPDGQVYNECGSPCTRTCRYNGPCMAMCQARCECPPDRPVWDRGMCIRQRDCISRPWQKWVHKGISGRGKRSIGGPNRYYTNYYDATRAFDLMGQQSFGDVIVATRPCTRRKSMWRETYRMTRRRGENNKKQLVLDAVRAPKLENAPEPAQGPAFTPAVDIRTFFPETWLWDLVAVGETGNVDLRPTLPHTVTEWLGSAFCSSIEHGLGVSEETGVKGFQPFFLSLTLPYSVVRGETVRIPVTVFNYLSDCLVVEMTLEETDELELEGDATTQTCVCGQETGTQYYRVTPKAIGQVNITIRAETINNNGICGNDLFMSSQIGVKDALAQPLLVEPQGRLETYTESEFACVSNGEEKTTEWDLTVPTATLVEDSERAKLQVIGDVMGPTLSNLDNLIRMPTGCGEQNMILFSPNIFVMQYLNATQQTSKSISDKALEFMRTGYQRELTYRLNDGSYSAFGQSDVNGSMWLTAFVVKSFAQASDFIFIDHNDLQRSVDWFITKQLANGCFPQHGRVIHKDMMGGNTGNTATSSLTAFVLVAMLEAQDKVNIPDGVIRKAFECLNTTLSNMYTMALTTYAYSLYTPRSSTSRAAFDHFNAMSTTDGGKHWTSGAGKSMSVEMTSYGLLSICTMDQGQAIMHGLPVVRWLTTQRNGEGGFHSTQDTVIGLQSLARFAAMSYSAGSNVSIVVQAGNMVKQLSVNEQNKLVLQQVPLHVPGTVKVVTSGEGCALIQADVRYNVEDIFKPVDEFELSIVVGNIYEGKDACKRKVLHICVKYLGADQASNMAVVGAKMVSGYIPIKSSIKTLMLDGDLDLKRYDIGPNTVEFYFQELVSQQQKCFSFDVEEFLEVDNTSPGIIKVFDYYKPELIVQQPYNIKRTCGTKEELPPVSEEEFARAHMENGGFVPQMRQPSGPIDIDRILEEIAGEEPEEVEEPLIVPETWQPLGEPGDSGQPGTKQDLPEVTREEYDRAHEEDAENIEQMRQPVEQPDDLERPGTKQDLPEVTRAEYDRAHEEDAENIEQMRQPVEFPGDLERPGTKQHLPEVTREEYDRAHEEDAENIEQMRQPSGPIDIDRPLEEFAGEEPEEVEEPLIVPEVSYPLGGDGTPVEEPLIVPEVALPVGPGDVELRRSLTCPVCSTEVPEDVEDIFCSSSHAYIAKIKPRNHRYPIRLLYKFRDDGEEERIDRNVHVEIDDICHCSFFDNRRGKNKVLILATEDITTEDGRSIQLQRSVTIISLRGNARIESQLLEKAKQNQC